MSTAFHFELPSALVLNATSIFATGLEHDGLPLVLIPGDGLFTVEEVAS